jgi:hypothetical protein
MNRIQIIVSHLLLSVNHLNGLVGKMISIDGHVHRHYLITYLLIGNQQIIQIMHHHHQQ